MIKKFEFLSHTSDLKIRAKAKSKDEAVENLVRGISEYISSGDVRKGSIEKKIKIAGTDSNEVVYRFIEEILFLLETKGFLTRKAKVKLQDNELAAVLKGHYVKGKNLAMIKAPTYSEMSLKKSGKFWTIEVVLDI